MCIHQHLYKSIFQQDNSNNYSLSRLRIVQLSRAQTIEAISRVATAMSTEHLLEYVIPLVKRLATGDWFTSRISACGMFTVAYPRVPTDTQLDLRKYVAHASAPQCMTPQLPVASC